MKRHRSGTLVAVALFALWVSACVSSGSGADFDRDGLTDRIEDPNDNFTFDPGEADFLDTDTDRDGLCDGLPPKSLSTCTGCEDCNDNGFWEPCLGETDPLNDDTDNDGIPDQQDPQPLDTLSIDCSGGNVKLPYGGSLPSGKSFPAPPTPTPPPTRTPTP